MAINTGFSPIYEILAKATIFYGFINRWLKPTAMNRPIFVYRSNLHIFSKKHFFEFTFGGVTFGNCLNIKTTTLGSFNPS
jgi:hypothetical protein